LVFCGVLHAGYVVDGYDISANDYAVGRINYETIENPVGDCARSGEANVKA